ncbi:MAG: hypothetical protein ACK5AZ_10345 [Bryobacteraceae bacterium]
MFRIVAICLSVSLGLAAWGCGRSRPQQVWIDPALLSMTPTDTVAMVGIRLEKVRTSPLYKTLTAEGEIFRAREFQERTGIDPERDLWEVLITSNGSESMAFARGRFSPHGREPQPGGDGVGRLAYKGYTLLGDEDSAVVFLNASTAVAGRTRTLRNLIDQRGANTLGPSRELSELLRDVPGESDLWAVSLGPAFLDQLAIPERGNAANLRRMFGSVESAMLGVDLAKGVDVAVKATYRGEADAGQAADALNLLATLGRWDLPAPIEREGRVLSLRMGLPETLVRKLAGQ